MAEGGHSPNTIVAAWRDVCRALPTGWWLFRHRLLTQRRSSLLGNIWLLVPALVMLLTAMLIQRRAGIVLSATPLRYPAFVLIGLIGWQGFADGVNAPLRRLTELRHLLTRTMIPHEAALIAAILDSIMATTIRAAVAFPAVFLLWTSPGYGALAIPFILIGIELLGVAVGLLLAPYALIYGDVRHLQNLALTLGLFLTPVFYPLHHWSLAAWNPMAAMIETLRAAADGGSMSPAAPIVIALAFALLVVGWFQYRIARPFLVAVQG
jgi:lipopolysaccharide transport system permease protein